MTGDGGLCPLVPRWPGPGWIRTPMSHPSRAATANSARTRASSMRGSASIPSGLLASSVESIQEGVILYDVEGRIHYANPAVEKIYVYSPRELIGPKHPPLRANQTKTARCTDLWQSPDRLMAGRSCGAQEGRHRDSSPVNRLRRSRSCRTRCSAASTTPFSRQTPRARARGWASPSPTASSSDTGAASRSPASQGLAP